MCGRFYVPEKDLDDFAALVSKVEKELLKKAGEMYPGDFTPVITPVQKNVSPTEEKVEGGEDVHIIQWGFPSQNGRPIFNARSETVHEKPLFKMPFTSRRCLIPARGFFEWKDAENSKKRIKHYLSFADGGMMYFAGLYWFFKDKEGIQKPYFTILTTDANDDVRPIHDRMPVIIDEKHRKIWLYENHQDEKLRVLLKPLSKGLLEISESKL